MSDVDVEVVLEHSVLDAQIGRISRAVEEAGFHWWTIYPIETKLNGRAHIGIHVELAIDVDSGKCIRYGLDWVTEGSVDAFIGRLEFADWCMREKAKEVGVQILPSPREPHRRAWSTVGPLLIPQQGVL